MKKMWSVMLIFGLVSLTQACPSCVSSAYDYSPPFFSDEYYRVTEEQDEHVMRTIRTSLKDSHEETAATDTADNN